MKGQGAWGVVKGERGGPFLVLKERSDCIVKDRTCSFFFSSFLFFCFFCHRKKKQKKTADAEMNVPSFVENPERTNDLPSKPGVGQNIAPHTSPIARNVFFVLISTFPVYSLSFLRKLTSKN